MKPRLQKSTYSDRNLRRKMKKERDSSVQKIQSRFEMSIKTIDDSDLKDKKDTDDSRNTDQSMETRFSKINNDDIFSNTNKELSADESCNLSKIRMMLLINTLKIVI